MQPITNPQTGQFQEEIRRTLLDFLDKCGMKYQHCEGIDTAFVDDCYAECNRRGYDMDKLSPYLRVGIDIAGRSYVHLDDKRIPRYVAIYSALGAYLDDFCQTEHGMTSISSFITRFTNNEPQDNKMMDDFANLVKEATVYWRSITATIIISSSLRTVSSLFLDHEAKGMKISDKAIQYPSFTRMLSGDPEAYSVFAFPPEMPMSQYVQALPDMLEVTNYINDLMSFYKEELQGEDLNYISLVGKTRGIRKLDALKLVANNTANAYLRVLDVLEGEAYKCFKAYSEGYIAFHVFCRRYRLQQLIA